MEIRFFEEVQKRGGKAYYVGGYVRDKKLGVPNKDIDIEVFGIDGKKLENILELFGKFKKTGNFEIYILNKNIEISISRDSSFNITKEFDIKNSAQRRDLTVNSIYYDPIENTVIDPLNGMIDIEKKILRYSDETSFLLDPLRILRVAYFYAKYEFELCPNLKKLIEANSSLLETVAKERVYDEIEKILLKVEKPSRAFGLFVELGVLKDIIQSENNLEKLDTISISKRTPLIMWTKFFQLLEGKKLYFFYNKSLLGKIEKMINAYENLLDLREKFSEYKLKKIAVEVDMKSLLKIYISNMGNADIEGVLFTKRTYKSYLKLRKSLEPLIKGRDLLELGFQNRKSFSEILEIIYEAQLKEEFRDKEGGINYIKMRYKEFTNLV